MDNATHIKSIFDGQWVQNNLEKGIRDLPGADIFPVVQRHIKKGMKILEAGCGLGKWVFYYHRQGYDITGVEWSQKTVDLIKFQDKNVKIFQSDARQTSFADGTFDLILSLGVIEHDIEGPDKALRELNRLLKKDGILIVSVPILTPIRRLIYTLKCPVKAVKSLVYQCLNMVRGKPFVSFFHLSSKSLPGLHLVPTRDQEGYQFFEYRFPLKTLTAYVEKAGFRIAEELPMYKIDAVHHDLSPLAGKWNYQEGRPDLNFLGKFVLRFLPGPFWHMAVCVARKS